MLVIQSCLFPAPGTALLHQPVLLQERRLAAISLNIPLALWIIQPRLFSA